jgi:hypothetical protein
MLLTICFCLTEKAIACLNVDCEQAEADKAKEVKHKRTSKAQAIRFAPAHAWIVRLGNS